MIRTIARGSAIASFTAFALAVSAAPSLAHFVYASASVSTFGSEGSGAGQFKTPQGVAVDEATGDVYVVDEGGNRVERFEAGGKYLSEIDGSETPAKAFVSPTSVAVDNSGGAAKGRVYVSDPSHNVVDAFDSSGKYLFQIEIPELRGITTDAQGHFWACTSHPAFEEYSEAGTLIQRQPIHDACLGMVVDSNGNVDIVAEGGGRMKRYSPPEYLGDNEASQLTANQGARRLAINTVTNNILQDSRSDGIVEWPPFGEGNSGLWSNIEEEFSVGLTNVGGLALNTEDGLLYASDEVLDNVKIFTPTVVPEAITGGVGKVTSGSGTIEGTVNPDKTKAEYFFEWGETTSYGNSTPLEEAEGEATLPIHATLENLEADTTYHYRVSASNAQGAGKGVDKTFTTSALPPETEGTPTASNVTRAGAVLHATLNGHHSTTLFHFVYVEEGVYDPLAEDPYASGGSTAPSDMGVVAGPQGISQLLEGLKPETTYHFKIIAFNQMGRIVGTDGTFTTGAATPPTVVTGGSNAIGENTATITGAIDTSGLPTSYGFEIGTSTDYGPRTGLGSVGAGASEAGVTLSLSGLQPGTTYHYRLTATNVDGTSYGADETFTTTTFASTFAEPPAPLPFVTVPSIAFPTEARPVAKKKTKAKKIKKRGKAKGKKKAKHKKKK